MKGKEKCKILRQIRRRIAEENDIELITKDCTYQGECKGTCPKCEAELRYLEQEIEKRQRLGKAVTVAALAASLTVGLTACVPKPLAGDVAMESTETSASKTTDLELMGEVAKPEPSDTEPTEAESTDLIMGAPPLATENTDFVELEGDVAYITEMTDAG